MCAIVDANIASEVFSPGGPEAGAKFFEWIDSGTGRLVAGGKLLEELYMTPASRWIRQAILAGKMKIVDKQEVRAQTTKLVDLESCRSDDAHVLALAQVSGARLLYSNDKDLQQDFKDKDLIYDPRGKIYSTLEGKSFSVNHRRLLKREDLCREEQ